MILINTVQINHSFFSNLEWQQYFNQSTHLETIFLFSYSSDLQDLRPTSTEKCIDTIKAKLIVSPEQKIKKSLSTDQQWIIIQC